MRSPWPFVVFVVFVAPLSLAAEELPLPPMEFDEPAASPPAPPPPRAFTVPAAPLPEVRRAPVADTVAAPVFAPPAPVLAPPAPPASAPPATPVAIAPKPVAAEPLVVPAPPESLPPRELSSGLPWLETGHLSTGLLLTGLDGAFGALAAVDAQLHAGNWSYGAGLLTGVVDGVGLTLVGPRGGVTFLQEGPLNLGASALFGVGAVSQGTGAAATVALQPELVAHLRLTPWLRASASVSWRFANVWAWSGPGGDVLGGPGLALGLEFGRFP